MISFSVNLLVCFHSSTTQLFSYSPPLPKLVLGMDTAVSFVQSLYLFIFSLNFVIEALGHISPSNHVWCCHVRSTGELDACR